MILSKVSKVFLTFFAYVLLSLFPHVFNTIVSVIVFFIILSQWLFFTDYLVLGN